VAAFCAAAVAFAVAPPAHADFPTGPGLSSALTSSDPGNTLGIQFLNGPTLHAQYCTTTCHEVETRSPMWAPDGSRAAFESSLRIATVRSDDPQSVEFLTSPTNGANDEEPAYRSDGSLVFARYGINGCSAIMLSTGIPDTEIPITPNNGDGACYGYPNGGPNGEVVFDKHLNGSMPEVWLWDGKGVGNSHLSKITTGFVPAISPDGTKVAYEVDGGDLWVSNVDGSGAHLLYHDPTLYSVSSPVWSPDGNTIAFYRFSNEVLTIPATGGVAPTVTGLTGIPAYRTEQRNAVLRLAGSNRFATSSAVSQSYWATAGDAADHRQPAQAVVLSRSDNFADALGGAALAAAKQGPLLLTPPAELNPDAATEIQRVLSPGGTVYLLGGTGAISQAVDDQIKALGYTTTRLAGASRYDTAVAIANAINPNPDLILAATGANFPDALAAGAAAGSYNTPGSGSSAVVVLTDNATLPAATKTYLDARVSATVPVIAIGGQAATATAIYGDNQGFLVGGSRYETAEFVAEVFFGGNAYAGLATGTNWPDALAGGALLGTLNSPLLLTAGTAPAIADPSAWYLSMMAPSVSTALIFGGTGVVAGSQGTEAGALISGPAGYVTNLNSLSSLGAASLRTVPRTLTPSGGHRTPAQIRAAAHLR
jgi:hypothetical protein